MPRRVAGYTQSQGLTWMISRQSLIDDAQIRESKYLPRLSCL